MATEAAGIRRATVADAAGIARVHVESWRTTYRGIVPQAYLDGLSIERREATWRRSLSESREQPFTFVAEQASMILGFASGGRGRTGNPAFPGEIEAIYLLAEAQGGGLGRRLVAFVAGELVRRGFGAMLLWMLAANTPARAFYERLGGRPVAEQPVTIGGDRFTEIAYGWDDLAPLIGR